jgi:hypothetical protein
VKSVTPTNIGIDSTFNVRGQSSNHSHETVHDFYYAHLKMKKENKNNPTPDARSHDRKIEFIDP